MIFHENAPTLSENGIVNHAKNMLDNNTNNLNR